MVEQVNPPKVHQCKVVELIRMAEVLKNLWAQLEPTQLEVLIRLLIVDHKD